jgi:hypothetical protein
MEGLKFKQLRENYANTRNNEEGNRRYGKHEEKGEER